MTNMEMIRSLRDWADNTMEITSDSEDYNIITRYYKETRRFTIDLCVFYCLSSLVLCYYDAIHHGE